MPPSVFLVWVATVIGTGTGQNGLRIDCQEPNVENGEIWGEQKSTYEYLENVKIRCWDRYRLLGKDVIKCRRDGTWSENPPYCQEITCPGIFTLPNGTISPNVKKAKIGTVVNVSCDDYHLLIGSETMRCNEDGIWEPKRMVHCKEVRCPDFPGIMHGEMHPSKSLKPGTVTITCEKGYKREGPEKLICTEDGKWSPNIMPYCFMVRKSHLGAVPLTLAILVTISMVASVTGCLCMMNRFKYILKYTYNDIQAAMTHSHKPILKQTNKHTRKDGRTKTDKPPKKEAYSLAATDENVPTSVETSTL